MPASDPSAPWEAPSPEELQALLPQYEITGILGRGGMGAVYRGRQVRLGRDVAIKILPETIAQGEDELNFAARFEEEARAMANLSHPGIVAVHDFGETSSGQLYLSSFAEPGEGSPLRSPDPGAPPHMLSLWKSHRSLLRLAPVSRRIFPAMNIYLDLTTAFNNGGRLRAVICSGQAVVLHRLAVMSKDGDWILREDEEALAHVLAVLQDHGASYRFGAPLDLGWLSGGWSSHFEFAFEGLRVRTDFFTRPPRLSEADLDRLWREHEGSDPPFVGAVDLARIKMTQREKDYPVIGELARLMPDTGDKMRYSRSARDLIGLCAAAPGLAAELSRERPLLQLAIGDDADPDLLAEALDAERRSLIKRDAARIGAYEQAAIPWREQWPEVRREIECLPLGEAHRIVTAKAESCLPRKPSLPNA